ncbi:MAG: protein phosphatase 2C domain-containing protein [Anaerolineae bacterium]|nr:protein phosphatase 2C domain-containing protein [Anaerolineae bacterium]
MPTLTPIVGSSQLRQDIETPLTALETTFGTALYLYSRSGDSISGKTVGQDYVTFRYKSTDLVFAVCDGVGQSFVGELAARILGDGLVDWLWQIEAPVDASSFSQAVKEALDKLAETSARQVADFQLPAHLPPIVVQALEMQRRYGSESMFVAGRLALAEPDPWLALCWLGDSPVAAIDIEGELMDLGPKGHTSERWNATTGVKGTIHTWTGSARRVARVAGYTDGLGLERAPTDAELARLMSEWKTSPPSDDASLFDVRLAPSPQTIGKPEAAPFQADDTRPIILTEELRTPVTSLQPLVDVPAGPSTLEGWRPLGEKEQSTEEKPLRAPSGAAADLSAQQQIRVWQQAALLGLTSAALAMLMLERLIVEQEE